jgi:hypothetical protein
MPQQQIPAEFLELGKKRIEAFVEAQTELLDKLQEHNRQWLDRWQDEANTAGEFASKWSAVRSVPEAMNLYQEWTSRGLEMMAEDGRQVLAETQDLIETGARLLANRWLSNPPVVGG